MRASLSPNTKPLGLLTRMSTRPRLARARVSHVAWRREDRDGAGPQLGFHLAERRLAASADRPADAPARPGDDRALATQAQIHARTMGLAGITTQGAAERFGSHGSAK
jgi:hypothetical protein